jgi:hypothetical protein
MTCNRLPVLIVLALLFVFIANRPAIGNEMPVGEITETRGPVAVVKDDGRQIRAEKGTPLLTRCRLLNWKIISLCFDLHWVICGPKSGN